jgi:predicted Zn-dependent peptidase
VRRVPLPPTLGASPREVIEDRNAPAPAVYIGFRVPGGRDERAPVVSMLAEMIGNGRSSPLYQSLVRERQVATSVFSFNFGLVEDADMLVVGAVGKPGSSADSLEAALLGELGGILPRLDAGQLARAQASEGYNLVNNLQQMGGFGGRGDALAESAVLYGDAGWINRRLPSIAAVTVDDVRALASRFLVNDNRAILVFVPATRQEAAQ